MEAPRILIVDDDPWLVKIIRAALEPQGYRIDSAANGEEAIKNLMNLRPDLILLDVLMPRMDGWTCLKRLRSQKESALIPVIFLTKLDTSRDRIQGFRLGADDYLPKPFEPEELSARVEGVLRRRAALQDLLRDQRQTPRDQSRPGFHGSLAQIGVASLLTLLEAERKTGALELTRPSKGESGEALLREGRVVHAEVQGHPELGPLDALLHFLHWADGHFGFSERPVAAPDSVGQSTAAILMEGARRMDETQRIQRVD